MPMQQVYYTVDSFDLENPNEVEEDTETLKITFHPKPSGNKNFKMMGRKPKGPRALAIYNAKLKYPNLQPAVSNDEGEDGEDSGGSSTGSSDVTYDTLVFELPDYFTQSTNPNKSVEFQYVHFLEYKYEQVYNETTGTYTTEYTGEYDMLPATMHSTLVQYRPSADCYVCATNVMYTWIKKFIIPSNMFSFEMWFRNIRTGEVLDVNPTKHRVLIELLLTY